MNGLSATGRSVCGSIAPALSGVLYAACVSGKEGVGGLDPEHGAYIAFGFISLLSVVLGGWSCKLAAGAEGLA